MNNYQEFIHLSRYARWNEEENRRETWEETVERYVSFFSAKFGDKYPKQKVKAAIMDMKVMPSMRALMTAGKALERDNVAGYNCSFLAVDHPRAFDECMFVLMCGTGVGFSVERQFVSKLPSVPDEFNNSETTIVVADSKIGWASAYKELINLLFAGAVPKWDMSKVRPAGARLKTFGGRASGPKPLEDLFKFTINMFKNASGRKLTSIECHDLICKIADIVVVGGVRRSALISLSNLSDDRMRNAKNGQWWVDNVQRALANNSAVYTERPDIEIFMKEWLALIESKSGERGIVNRASIQRKIKEIGVRDPSFDFGLNPCVSGDMVLDLFVDHSYHIRMDAVDVVSLFNQGHHISVKAVDLETGDVGYYPMSAAVKTKENARLLKITDSETGKFIRVTKDHLVYTKNRGYVEAKNLVSSDELIIE